MRLTLLMLGSLLLLPLPAALAEDTPIHNSDPSMGSTMDATREGKFGLDLGTVAPDFTVTTYDGREVQLRRDYLNTGGWTVVATYPGGMRVEDNLQLQRFLRTSPLLEGLNTRVIAITTDTPEQNALFVEANTPSFEVLADPQARMFENWRLLNESPEPGEPQPDPNADVLESQYGSEEAVAAADRLAMRDPQSSIAILDPEGIVRYMRVNPDANEEAPLSDEEIIEELSRLQNLDDSDNSDDSDDM